MSRKKIVILGGGITGLVSAYYLSEKYSVILIEKERYLGGSAAGFIYKDFILDCGPHKIYTELPGIINEIKKITPLIKIKKKNSIYLKGNYYDFPLSLGQIATRMPITAIRAGLDMLKKQFTNLPDDSYENFLVNRFGKTLYSLSFKDYAFKIWNSNPKELDPELARRRVAVSGFSELLKSIITKKTSKISAEFFYYPPNGIKQIIDSLISKIKNQKSKVLTNANISEIRIKNNKVDFIRYGKKRIFPDYVISTIPLDSLSKIIKPSNPLFDRASSSLKYQKLNIIYFILKKPRALKDCWIFFPEGRFIFQRVSEQKAFSPRTSPRNKTALMVETTREISPKLIDRVIGQMEFAGILKKEEIEEHFVKSIKKAYPLYHKGFLNVLKEINLYASSIGNLYLLGRQGLFNYNNMDQCWDMALKISTQLRNNHNKEDWAKVERYFDNYKIVD